METVERMEAVEGAGVAATMAGLRAITAMAQGAELTPGAEITQETGRMALAQMAQMMERTCGCGAVFRWPAGSLFKRELCDACLARRCEEAEAREQGRVRCELAAKWEKLCPPLYRDTDLARLGIPPEKRERVLAWRPHSTGLGLVGQSGAGKTRLAYKLIERLFFAGVAVRAINAKQFERWCARMFDKDDDARRQLESLRRAEVLFVDDLGKEKFTERVESELYDLVETRTAHLRPILWTSNATATRLKEMLSPDRGEPILRRLKEFCVVIAV